MRATMFRMAAALSVLAARGAAAQESLGDLDKDLYLCAAVQVDNVTAWPVCSRRPAVKYEGEFVTLPEAQAASEAVVREIGAAPQAAQPGPPAPQPQPAEPPQRAEPLPGGAWGSLEQAANPANTVNQAAVPQQAIRMQSEVSASVNELVIENRGQRPILVLAGTLLKGGRQDRQVGQDFIVPPGKTVPVAAFCVEHGRWTANREGQQTGGVFEAQASLAVKSVRGSGQYEANQQKVWDSVADENRKAGKKPDTGTFMATALDSDKDATERRARIGKAISDKLSAMAATAAAPVGIAYAVDGKAREVRVFSHPQIFQRFAETLVATVAMEGDLAQRTALASGKAVHASQAEAKLVVELVKGAQSAPAEKVKTKAGNTVELRKGGNAWGSDCYEGDASRAPVTRSIMNAQ